MRENVNLLNTEYRKLGTLFVLCLVLVFAVSVASVASVEIRCSERNDAGWFVLFHAENEDNFKGEVAHLHIYEGELDQARDFVEESINITISAESDFADEISVGVGKVVSWIMGAAGAICRNSDGSFDIYFMTGAKDFFGVTTPVFFVGFVPDQVYKPPLPAEFISITGIPAANSLGGHFRSQPKPYY